MATDLHDRLTDLAGHTRSASPPVDLWDRGVRRQRLARAGQAAVAAALVLLVAAGGWTWHASRPVQPADPGGGPHLPDQFFYNVSPWTKAFDGPPGPLVTVFPNVRETLRTTTNGIVGVTADSSTYGFLALPDDAVQSSGEDSFLALSPDGRRLAFWVRGTPSGSPNTTFVEGYTVTGVGVYDTVSGRLRESSFPTVHGLDPRALLWADDSTLLLTYGQIQGPDGTELASSSSVGATAVWPVSSPRPETLPDNAFATSIDNSSTRATDGRLLSPGRRRWLVTGAGDPTQVRSFRTHRSPEVMVLSPDGRRAVGVLRAGSDDGPLVIARVPRQDGGEAAVRTLPWGRHWTRPLAWLDDDRVVVGRERLVHDRVNGEHVGARLDSVDLRTGAARPLVENVGFHDTGDSDPWIATGLLGSPVVKATPPPSPPNLRSWAWGLGVAGGLVLLFGIPMIWSTRGRRA